MNQERVLRGAVVGAGFMGETHIKGYARLENVNIEALIDPFKDKAEKIALPLGIPVYESVDRAADELQLDFIDICAPTPFHVDLIAAGFRNNCHIVVEKPLSATAEDTERISSLAAKSDRRIMVAHVCRFMPIYIHARQAVVSERLGKPRVFSARRYGELPSWSVDDWINNRVLSGGTLIDLSIHDIDISNWLMGEAKRVNASEVTSYPNGPAHVVETIEYEDGKVSQIEGSHLLPKGYDISFDYQLLLEEGIISGGLRDGKIYLHEYADGRWSEVDFSTSAKWEDPYTEELDHFTTALMNQEEFRITLQEAVQTTYSALSLRSSIMMGKRIDMNFMEINNS